MTDTDTSLNPNSPRTSSTAEALRPAMDTLLAGVHEAMERLSNAVYLAADRAEVTGNYLKDVQRRALGSCRGYVRDQPLASLGMAVAGGVLLGWLLRRR